MGACVFYDGKKATAHPVKVVLENGKLLVYSIEGVSENLLVSWNVDRLSRLKIREEEGEFCLTQGGTARLIIRDSALQQKLNNNKFIKTPMDIDKKIITYCVVGLAAMGLLFWQGIPLLARPLIALIPYSIDKRLGEAAYRQLLKAEEGEVCDSSAGMKALAKIKMRSFDQPLNKTKIAIIDSDTENALALPGGYIVIFSGLLDKAHQPAMLAAVLAHEAGHIVGRHAMERLVSQLATGAIITLVTGDISLLTLLGIGALTNHYTQKMEKEADIFAKKLMRQKQIDPQPIAAWFLGMKPAEAGMLGYFQTHPTPIDRAEFFTKEKWQTKAVLTPQEWVALKNICN